MLLSIILKRPDIEEETETSEDSQMTNQLLPDEEMLYKNPVKCIYTLYLARLRKLIKHLGLKKYFLKGGVGIACFIHQSKFFLICRNLFSKSSFIQIIFNSIILLHCYDFDTYLIHME